MRLLIVGISWPPETFLTRLIEGLVHSGVDVTVASSVKPDLAWRSQPSCHWLPAPAWQGSIIGRLIRLMRILIWKGLRSPGDIRLLAKHIKQAKTKKEQMARWYRLSPFVGKSWDAIYFPWNSAAINYLPLFDLGCPIIISCRGSQINVAPHNPKRIEIQEGLYTTFQKAAAVHCVSDAIRKEAIRYGLNSSKAWIIRPAVDSKYFSPDYSRRTQNGKYRIITTGSLIWRKGYEYALMCIRYLLEEKVPVYFEIVGDGPEYQRLLYTLHDLDLQEHVYFHGRLSPSQVRDKLQYSDIFLLSSLSEGISNAVLEAMACGLPVVITDCGGMREVIADGVEGFLVPVRDPSAMAYKIKLLWEQPELRKKMGKAGRERVISNFSLIHQGQQFVELISSVISNTC